MCTELEARKAELATLAEEWRTHSPPATARRPPPRLATRVAATAGGAEGLAAMLLRLGTRAAALMRDGVCRCDVDEWVEAKVMEPHRRATELVAQAERVIAEPPTVEMLCRTDGGS